MRNTPNGKLVKQQAVEAQQITFSKLMATKLSKTNRKSGRQTASEQTVRQFV